MIKEIVGDIVLSSVAILSSLIVRCVTSGGRSRDGLDGHFECTISQSRGCDCHVHFLVLDSMEFS